jgi:glycosyltransferase involved in cell wall biosynthesis
VVLEAMAYGKPVIGSDLGGVSEIIDNGRDGLLFEAGNVEALKAEMEKLIEDDALVEQMGIAARKKIEDKYSPEHHYARLLGIFENACRAPA